MLGGASKKMIDQRLKELEDRDMVIRTVISDRPIAVTYELTDFGRSALDILISFESGRSQISCGNVR